MHQSIKPIAGALVLSLILAACGGGDGDGDTAVLPAGNGSSSSAASSAAASSAAASSAAASSAAASSAAASSAAASSAAASSAAASSAAASSAAASSAAASSAAASSAAASSAAASSAAAITTAWGFNDANYAASTGLFAAAYSATADNGIAALEAGSGTDLVTAANAKTVDGLIFDSSSIGVLRYRPAGSANNATGTTGIWNTNGSFFSANTPVIATAALGTDITTLGNMRTWMAIPVTASKAFTVSITYKPTNTTAGQVALLCSDNKILAMNNTGTAQAEGTLSYSGAATHTCTHVKFFYSREGVSSGGVNITAIQRVQ